MLLTMEPKLFTNAHPGWAKPRLGRNLNTPGLGLFRLGPLCGDWIALPPCGGPLPQQRSCEAGQGLLRTPAYWRARSLGRQLIVLRRDAIQKQDSETDDEHQTQKRARAEQ